jgi:hypothetical protein
MAKRSIDEWNSELEDEQKINELHPETKTPETTRLRLLKDLRLNIVGKVTGKTYTFSGGGAELDVDKQDATIMLTKVSGQCNCPGGVGSTPYFEIVR